MEWVVCNIPELSIFKRSIKPVDLIRPGDSCLRPHPLDGYGSSLIRADHGVFDIPTTFCVLAQIVGSVCTRECVTWFLDQYMFRSTNRSTFSTHPAPVVSIASTS